MAARKPPFHELVATRIIEQLEQGTAPWQKQWEPGSQASTLPYNPTTGNRYRGINSVHLQASGRDDPRWMTYKQAQSVDAQVRKGEKGTTIQFWKFEEERTVRGRNGGKTKERIKLDRPRVFFSSVFNADQIAGLPALEKPEVVTHQWERIERAEALLRASGADIRHEDQSRAYYSPAGDYIKLPQQSQFKSPEGYYSTAIHELGHWTGHPSRLDRDLAHSFGTEGYAREELRAEIASLIVGSELNLGHDPNQHAAYVGSWIKALREDPLEIFRAAADAEKIGDYVMALEKTRKQNVSRGISARDGKTTAMKSAVIKAIDAQTNDPVLRERMKKAMQKKVSHHNQSNTAPSSSLKEQPRESSRTRDMDEELSR